MLRKSWITLGLAVTLLVTFTVIVTAQQATPQPTALAASPSAQIEPITAVITQQVPVSLTLRISGATGVQTVTVPVLLNLNIQVGLGRPLTSAFGISVVAVQPQATSTPTVNIVTPAPATPTALPATATPVLNPPATSTTPLTGTPTLTTTVTPTVTPTPTRPVIIAPACPSPGTVILSPGVNQVVTGTVNIIGTATQTNFDYYKLEYAVGANANNDASEYRYFAGGSTQITNSVLGAFDSLALPNRAYTLRLTVVDKTGNFPLPCQVTVLVQNP